MYECVCVCVCVCVCMRVCCVCVCACVDVSFVPGASKVSRFHECTHGFTDLNSGKDVAVSWLVALRESVTSPGDI